MRKERIVIIMKSVFLITISTSERKCTRNRKSIRYDDVTIIKLPAYFNQLSFDSCGQIAVTIKILNKKKAELYIFFLP